MVEATVSEAVLFFEEGEITRQMNFAEFQAILDNFAPMNDMASRSFEAVYVRINPSLQVKACVFCIIPFDNQGYVESDWNVPLQQLADTAAKGPNLGAGPINLACYSQCPVEWRKNELWDPHMDPEHNDFQTIVKVIKNNLLGFIYSGDQEESQSSYAGSSMNAALDDDRAHTAMIIKEQRLRQKLLISKAEQDMRQLSLDHQERILKYQEQIKTYKKELKDLRSLNSGLQDELATQTEKVTGLREYFENKLANVHRVEAKEMREHFETELSSQIDDAIKEHKTLLHTKEVELLYRSEREDRLKEELLELQKENQRLLIDNGDIILDQLHEAGVDFVIYHPGVGHMTIQVSDVAFYLENPLSYVANRCGVNEVVYRAWLDHYHSPVCMHDFENGELCAVPIPRLDDPSLFIIGESDRCDKHRDS